jgi:hypothetical protein
MEFQPVQCELKVGVLQMVGSKSSSRQALVTPPAKSQSAGKEKQAALSGCLPVEQFN